MINKDITVILLLFNTPHSSLNNLKNYKNFKTIILDQSNDSATKRKVKKILPNIISYKITNKNFGFAKGINSLVKKTKTRFFLCTQPDVNISQDSILNLKKVFSKKKDAIISIPNLNYSKKKRNKK
jgi:GT2 family glycosyltransferase